MKIITPGCVPEEKQFVGTCMRCKAQVQFVAREARRSSHRNEVSWTIDCPTPKCGSTITACE